jgi:hypothetical protein
MCIADGQGGFPQLCHFGLEPLHCGFDLLNVGFQCGVALARLLVFFGYDLRGGFAALCGVALCTAEAVGG